MAIYIAYSIARQAKQLEQVIFAGFTHTPTIELAEKIISVLGSHFSKIFYSDNSSTAVEVGIKMALQYWHNQGITGKTKIIAFDNAYHGDTFGGMSAGARSAFNAAFNPMLFEVHHIPVPDEETIEAIKTQLSVLANQGNIAASIFDPLMQGACGTLMHRAEHLDQLIAIAKEQNILCVADEVMTGLEQEKTFN